MHAKTKFLLIAVIMIVSISCRQGGRSLKPQEGFVNTAQGKIWYRVSGQGNQIPIVVLHGGPGSPSYYLNPLKELGKNRNVISYDQLGCGRSGEITDTSLITLPVFVEHLRILLAQLGIKEFYLYGHSWGSILATEFYLKHPQGIRGLILASPILNARLWAGDADTLLSTIPDSLSTILRKSINGVQQDSVSLNAAMNFYLEKFGARKRPLSADFDSTFTQMGQNVFLHLWGASEFVMGGALTNYDRTNELSLIKIPTLYLIGEFDEVRLSTAKFYQQNTANSSVVVIKQAGHMTMQDNPADNIIAIEKFLKMADDR